MDGVLADFDGHLLEITGDLAWPQGYARFRQEHRYSSDHITNRADRDEARRRINTSGFFSDLQPVPGAIDGIMELAEMVPVWIVTKPLEANPTCRDDKARWLNRHLGRDWERRLIVTPDKSMVIGSILLDDAPKPEWFDRASWRPVIFPWSFNGAGSVWANLPRWQWGDHPQRLLDNGPSAL